MKKILILGGGGMIGQKLAQKIIRENTFGAADITLFDRAFPVGDLGLKAITGNICRSNAGCETLGR